MFSCLKNRIGVIGCDAGAAPASQLYVNSLPGISLEKFISLTDDEQTTFLEVWANVSLRACMKFESLVRAEIGKCWRIVDKSIIECLVCSNIDLFDSALLYVHGCETMIEITGTDNMNRFTTIDLPRAEDLKAEFYSEFVTFVSDAVKSIDPAKTDCFEGECIECAGTQFIMQAP